MKNKRWTAAVMDPFNIGRYVRAQCKSSKAELIKRVRADDPMWSGEFHLYISKAWPKKHFSKGIAFRYW